MITKVLSALNVLNEAMIYSCSRQLLGQPQIASPLGIHVFV